MKRLLSLIFVISIACSKPAETRNSPESVNPTLLQILKAHGGLAKWDSLKTLEFTFDGERHIVDLKSRMTRVEQEGRAFGFDGEKIWVSPDSLAEGNEAFMYNLMFYFFAMPFVLADPGIKYEEGGQKVFDGISYNALVATYNDSIGNSPKDRYMLLSNPHTNQMEWLMYNATFGASEAGEDFNLIRYKEWTSVNGLLFPAVIQWTAYQGDSTGAVQGEVRFEKVIVRLDALSPDFFRK